MDAHFTFHTQAFDDPASVRDGTVNGIVGHTLAGWLAQTISTSGFKASEPWAEDHGWDFSIEHANATYLCACSIDTEGAPPFEAHVAVARQRSFWERLTSKNTRSTDDPVVAAIRTVLAASPDVASLEEDA